jgi:hypothetical protein
MHSERGNASGAGLAQWERSFRAAARDDRNRILRAHLRHVELPDEPDLLLEGTVLVVRTCVAYLMLDNQSVDGFLARQQYDPTNVVDAPFLVTIDICGKAFARIATPVPFEHLDLADLYEAPWERYKMAGYNQFFVSRTDGEDLAPDEIEALDEAVTRDLRFDYTEDDLSFWFDPDTVEGVLIVSVQDVFEEDE